MSSASLSLLLIAAAASNVLGKTIEVSFGPTEQFPPVLRLDVGDCVQWTNTGNGVHVVQGADGEFDSGYLSPGERFRHCFHVEGVTQYHDGVHPQQKSLVVVGKRKHKLRRQKKKRKKKKRKEKKFSFLMLTICRFFFFSMIFFFFFSLSFHSSGEVDFVQPRPFVPTEKPVTVHREFTPRPAIPEPTLPTGVSIVATDVAAAEDSSDVVYVSASFAGSPGRVSAYATLSDGCNTLRSDEISVRAGQQAVRFGPLSTLALRDGPLKVAVVIGSEPYAGDDITTTVSPVVVVNPVFDTQTLLWSTLHG
jgi:plastocyanin